MDLPFLQVSPLPAPQLLLFVFNHLLTPLATALPICHFHVDARVLAPREHPPHSLLLPHAGTQRNLKYPQLSQPKQAQIEMYQRCTGANLRK